MRVFTTTLVSICISMFCASCMEQTEGKKNTFYLEQGFLKKQIPTEIDKLNGLLVTTDSSGKTMNQRLYINGDLRQEIYFYDNGIMKTLTFYKQGESIGKWYSWYPSGMPEYVSDSWNGEMIEYYPNGSKKMRKTFTTPQTKEHIWVWSESGILMEEVEIQNADTSYIYPPASSDLQSKR